MSTLDTTSVEAAVAAGRPTDLTPVALDASCLGSTAPAHLRDLKAGLADEGYLPAELSVEAQFCEDDPFAVQSESDRLREYVRAAAFLGVGRVIVDVGECCRPDEVSSALAALDERAHREGVAFEVRGSIDA
ncbi:hypothetical protein E6P09_10735 [Haloferax mediterranei ATCC 33500]|uniref:DUF7961 domain-containing protein n=1 Tax=Haloferax mediterranei (strain ATCC 33500 / DSM 1411 / JCM 8866 / NBRC 14739 / NCIMB 2177 / R-4) TaxID=523841 RepID=I3R4T7_HALMT|nr:hypothetical protein [Haloferax mediterranei]AFK19247.2 hypothetical protein HFX_1540 [Haloferax mediterranei ATCC 33500]AHZ21394.1 hypothetical protein BM92_01425 [Haloferax mediterranei ATCC 33500]EMA04565.1 hypothetical protein C439_02782 [Haloferax mediterranei ATCC 33500]MDX5989349.1 hypothetical protein [Haloferax mediterranei ATCC 33500]QCQ75714.1 hypothetical protein E6P09_10735 [Haloferax mediterranei ATCC 33500]